ncbi:hypothetical protein TREMEDRAFT_25239 [Tremella mesenterica DSM 1558]|uniref:uncharacterized protein n=1 Tax=Tremella mesenterica (strain ATCC 24925 / CBS 8224 / DSM 1558 / NBRC 9311 / NRRL Y-6157 / RJB 2259-6 / UBC 559-6) TaxID=578456 RepID=UPI0003F490CF|nr:uncharacterized protein TREMEDRAFT_25239 [Tremella mesenterica DSM 1558]EIW72326.1 hypothetical protein TREMEDRAFT_25239 [Tremella mesenterica DSM 1558]
MSESFSEKEAVPADVVYNPVDTNATLDGERDYLPGDELYIDPKVEAKIVRKFDIHIAPLILVIYIICALDRSNIGNAAAAGMSTDLHLTGNQLNVAVSIYYVTYVCAEIPVVLFFDSHKVTNDPVWAFVMVGSGFMTNYAGLIVTRLMIGLCEAVSACSWRPGTDKTRSGMYKRREQSRRFAILFLSLMLSGAVGGLFASGFLKMDGVQGRRGWRWIYLMEAVISFAVAIIVFIFLPNNAATAYFFNEEEKAVIKKRDAQRAAYMGHAKIQKIDFTKAFKDPKIYLSAAIQFSVDVCLYGFSTFLPVIISGLGKGFTGVRAQLLTVPVYAAAAVVYVICAFGMDHFENRHRFIIPAAIVNIIGYAVLIGVGDGHYHVKYAMTFLVGCGLYVADGGNMTWLIINQAPQIKRSIGIATQQMMGNAGGIVAGQIYMARDKPNYHIGHSISMAFMCVALVFTFIKAWYLKRVNKRREEMSPEERQRLIDEGVVGDIHPDFRLKL